MTKKNHNNTNIAPRMQRRIAKMGRLASGAGCRGELPKWEDWLPVLARPCDPQKTARKSTISIGPGSLANLNQQKLGRTLSIWLISMLLILGFN
ncbi:MAG: hypothetical protein KW788_03660 [Candidatus Doudnabacteria bacterium]|nr:hypothetical protein [Candidatus Doudnabacteria bacterium]